MKSSDPQVGRSNETYSKGSETKDAPEEKHIKSYSVIKTTKMDSHMTWVSEWEERVPG